MLQRARDTLKDLVAFDTVSHRSNMACVEWMADRLDGLAEIRLLPHTTEAKASLLARVGPPLSRGIVLSGHVDVVSTEGQAWSSDPFRLTERDGRLYGRGTCDMKGFVALALTCAESLRGRTLARPLWIAASYDEETGCLAAPELARALAESDQVPAAVIVGEPSAMRPIALHKGCTVMRLDVKGNPAHSSTPGRGTSAILPVTRFVAFLERYFQDRSETGPFAAGFDPPSSTFNAGVIAGGTAMNIIAEFCRLDWEFRDVPGDDAEAIYRDVERYVSEEIDVGLKARDPEAGATLTRITYVPCLAQEPGGTAEGLASSLTGRPAQGAVPFGTEAGIFQTAGLSTVVCGPGDVEQAHKADEFISLEQFTEGWRFMERLAERLTTQPDALLD